MAKTMEQLYQERYDRYMKLKKELAFVASKQNERGPTNAKRRWKGINKEMRRRRKSCRCRHR